MTESDKMKALADYLDVTARYHEALRARRALALRALAERRMEALQGLFFVVFRRLPTEGELWELINL